MGKILAGRITYGRTVNLGDYNSKKAEAAFDFQVAEDEAEDAAINRASTLAVAKVEELLTGKVTKPVLVPADANMVPGAVTPVPETKERKKPGPKPKAKVEDAAEITAEPAANISTGEERKDPADIDDFSPAVEPITDKELHAACQKKVVELTPHLGDEARKKIRLVVAKFVTAPQGLVDIPPESRAEFLKQLAALTA